MKATTTKIDLGNNESIAPINEDGSMNTQMIIAEAARAATTEFPGMEALGTTEKVVADAVLYALRAIAWSKDVEAMEAIGAYENTEAYGRLDAMVQYGVVNPSAVVAAIQRWRLA